jgi:hypothetical protein
MKTIAYNLFFTMMTSCLVTRAYEGFNTSLDQSPIIQTWASTYAIIHRNENRIIDTLGTAFVVDKFSKDNRYFLILMTAGHVVDDTVKPTNASPYEGIQIYTDFSKKVGVSNPVVGVLLDSTIISSGIENEKDIGSFLVEVREQYYQAVRTIKISTNGCAIQTKRSLTPEFSLRTYIVGFPGVHTRPIENQNVKIENPDVVQKRWSSGAWALGYATGNRRNLAKDLLWSTADSLAGDSGGPVIDQNGNWMGVNVGAQYTEGNMYKSNEMADTELGLAKTGYSFFVGCSVAQPYAIRIENEYRELIK